MFLGKLYKNVLEKINRQRKHLYLDQNNLERWSICYLLETHKKLTEKNNPKVFLIEREKQQFLNKKNLM